MERDRPQGGGGGALTPHAPRLAAIDALRGAAVIAMVVYHTAWDLSTLALIRLDVVASPGWSLFARAIAATFLTLVGIGLVLAHGRGLRMRPFLRRLALLVLAAAAITAATRVVFPDSFIFFGILHNIAVSSVLALPFLRAPVGWAIAGAIFAWTAPVLEWPRVFDALAASPLGLGRFVPDTNDYVPVFPWTGFVLAGIAAARLGGPPLARLPMPRPGRVGSALGTIGRYSLLVYLLHQPLIFGALSGLREITGPDPVAEAAPFTARCTESCRLSGPTVAICRAACGCTVEGLRREGLWAPVLSGRLGPDETIRAETLARACLRPLAE